MTANYKFCGITRRLSQIRAKALIAASIIAMSASSPLSVAAALPRVSIDANDITVKQLLHDIESKCNYTFAYSDGAGLPTSKRVTLHATDRPIDEILAEVLPGADVEIKGTTIMLTPAKAAPETSKSGSAKTPKANKKTVTGRVVDDSGEPIIGATVMQKGTNNGTSTDIDGNFTLSISGKNPTLVARYVGCEPKEIKAAPGTSVNITLDQSGVKLNDVVVTALGIRREQKSLGYAVSKVSSEDLNNTVSGNWLNSMNGKVAGLSMTSAGSGPLGSMRIVLRGEQSLNYGANEALFVVDGVPITSGDAGTGSGASFSNSDAPIDFGNGASEINPEDVESVTVLKGPAATALYGSRAANGAIVITTKSGKAEKGVGVTLNSSITWEKAGYYPDFQGVYGPGADGGFAPYAFWRFKNIDVPEGFPAKANGSRMSYGEAYSADKLRSQYNSYNPVTGEWTLTPFVYADDWFTGFMETGVTYRNNITVSSNNGKGTSARLSITDTRNDWILPNTGYKNQTVSVALNTKMNKWMKLQARVNYLHKSSDNLPVQGYSNQSPFYMLIWGNTNISPAQYREEYFGGKCTLENYSGDRYDGKAMVGSMGNAKPVNPYRQMYEATNAINKDRVYGNVALNIAFPVKGLTLDLRAGTDISVDWRQQKKPFRSPDYDRGFYREQNNRDIETNLDFMLRYVNNKLVGKRLGLNAAFGGNSMIRRVFRNSVTLKNLGEEGIYNTTNLPDGEFARPYNWRSHKVVNSFYGFVNLSWDDTYYLDLTARNDWSSALGRGNWSFFYPSVSASVLLDNALKLHDSAPWIDMLKIRGSWANVGNDTNPYTLTDTYASSSSYPSSSLLPTTAANYFIKPENVESWEIGIESMFLHNRFGVDVAFYNSSTTNQIVSAVADMITGVSARKMNAGEIRNRGVEIALHVIPVQTRNFTWSFDINWSRNWNKLVSLDKDWDPSAAFIQNDGAGGSYASIRSYVGEEMGWIYGKGYKRAPQGATYTDANGNVVDCSGMKIIDASNGIPLLDDAADTRIAKVNPTWRGGMTHSFRYRDFTLGLTFSAQMGGHAFSHTNAVLSYMGKLTNSLEGRYDGLTVEGVVATENADGSITYTPNTRPVASVIDYYQKAKYIRNNAEEHTFKTDFFKLGEARLDYSLPRKICRKLRVVQGAAIGVYATNIFCITDWPQFDPEAAGTMNGTNIVNGLEMGALPMTRTYGFNIKLSF